MVIKDPHADSGMEDFGYKQSLDRSIGKFASFAAGVSYISILTGTFQLFYFGFGTAGPAYLWSWPMVFVGQMAVALCFMELAAKYPVAGSVYNWSKKLGSRLVGWSSGWLMLTASIVTISAVVLAYQLNLPRIWSGFQIIGDGTGEYDFAANAVVLGSVLIAFTTLINALGVKLMSRINSAGVFIELIAAVLIAIILALNVKRGPDIFFSTQGYGAGESYGYLGAFLVASLASLYVMYGFDTASSLGEETVEPRRTAPKAIFRAILASFVIGGAILVFAVMSAPNLEDPQIGESSGGLQYIVEQVMWGPLGKIFLICIVVAVTVCTLAVHTAAIRLTFAMARDNALAVRREARDGQPEDPDADHPRVDDRDHLGDHPGDQHRSAADLHRADLDRDHHDLPRVPDGDRSDAQEAAPRRVAAKGSEGGRLLHHGQMGPARQHLRRGVGRVDGVEPGMAARRRVRRALVQHLGRIRLHRRDPWLGPAVVFHQGPPSHRHAGIARGGDRGRGREASRAGVT